jgi:uncharacterized protein YfaS (alpha-2-macroglobulin family)
MLVSERTDANGRAHFADFKGYERERTPEMFLVRRGEDLSFLPFAGRDRLLDFSRFDIGGERNARDAGKLTGYLYSDRGMYRPGDQFHIGMIVRAADWTKPLTGVPLEAEVGRRARAHGAAREAQARRRRLSRALVPHRPRPRPPAPGT